MLPEFIYGVVLGLVPGMLAWVHSAGQWKTELTNIDERIGRIEALLDSLVGSKLRSKHAGQKDT